MKSVYSQMHLCPLAKMECLQEHMLLLLSHHYWREGSSGAGANSGWKLADSNDPEIPEAKGHMPSSHKESNISGANVRYNSASLRRLASLLAMETPIRERRGASDDCTTSLPLLTTTLQAGSVLPHGGQWRLSQTAASSDKNNGQPATAADGPLTLWYHIAWSVEVCVRIFLTYSWRNSSRSYFFLSFKAN